MLSAFSMMSVLAFGMSMPVSMMVVQTRMSISPSAISFMTFAISFCPIFP